VEDVDRVGHQLGSKCPYPSGSDGAAGVETSCGYTGSLELGNEVVFVSEKVDDLVAGRRRQSGSGLSDNEMFGSAGTKTFEEVGNFQLWVSHLRAPAKRPR